MHNLMQACEQVVHDSSACRCCSERTWVKSCLQSVAGVDVPSLLQRFGLKPSDTSEKVGTFAIAYAAHKALSPVRFPPTVALTPVVAKLIGKKPTEADEPQDLWFVAVQDYHTCHATQHWQLLDVYVLLYCLLYAAPGLWSFLHLPDLSFLSSSLSIRYWRNCCVCQFSFVACTVHQSWHLVSCS